jgi:hypothetical protein
MNVDITAGPRHKLAELSGQGEPTQSVQRRIRDATQRRLAIVEAGIDELLTLAHADAASIRRYGALVQERERLHQVLTRMSRQRA